jgi:hypothetical protein
MKKQFYSSQTEAFHITRKMGISLAIFAALLTWYILPEYGSALANPAAASEEVAPAIAPAAVQASTTVQPTITVVNVIPGGYVELSIQNLPGDDEFRVTMGPAGSMGIGGGLIAHFNTNEAGTYDLSFEIYAPVRDNAWVDVRIDDGEGVAAFARFRNQGAAAAPVVVSAVAAAVGGGTVPAVSGVGAQPAGWMQVIHVVRSGYVVVQLSNIAEDQNFSVRMGPADTLVAHVSNGDETTITATFEMAAPVRNFDWFVVHLQSDDYNFIQNVSNSTY